MRKFLLVVVVCLGMVACARPERSSSSVSPVAPSILVDVRESATPATVARLAPDPVLIDQFEGQLDRALRKAFRQTGPSLRSVASDLVVVPIASRAANTYTFPNPGGNQVEIPSDVSKVTFVINIALADKLSVGKTASWFFSVSADDGQTWNGVGGGGWISYGPAGFFNNFLQEWNPDPRTVLTLFSSTPIVNHRGKLLRGVLTLPQALNAGVTITTE